MVGALAPEREEGAEQEEPRQSLDRKGGLALEAAATRLG